jgi:hypothetical protein
MRAVGEILNPESHSVATVRRIQVLRSAAIACCRDRRIPRLVHPRLLPLIHGTHNVTATMGLLATGTTSMASVGSQKTRGSSVRSRDLLGPCDRSWKKPDGKQKNSGSVRKRRP